MSEFHNKVILITGAGKGAGSSLAESFAALGAIIAANDITPINLDDTIQTIITNGGRAKGYIADVSKKMPLQAMVNQIIEDWGPIDILVTDARVVPTASVLEMDEWDWHRTLDVNLTGIFLAIQTIGRVMRAGGGGSMVLIIGPEVDIGNQSAYHASVAGIKALAVSAAKELWPLGIRINAVLNRDDAMDELHKTVLKLCSPAVNITGQVIGLENRLVK